MKNFEDFKSEIVLRANKAGACSDEYKRALQSNDFKELFTVIGDNFIWCCDNKVIDIELLSEVEENILSDNNFFLNKSSGKGFILSGSATVRAYGSATVRAYGSAYINSYSNIEHKVSDKAILRYYYKNKIVFGENINVKQ